MIFYFVIFLIKKVNSVTNLCDIIAISFKFNKLTFMWVITGVSAFQVNVGFIYFIILIIYISQWKAVSFDARPLDQLSQCAGEGVDQIGLYV